MSKVDYYNFSTTGFYNFSGYVPQYYFNLVISTIRKYLTVHLFYPFTIREHYQNLNNLHFLIIVVVLLPLLYYK